MSHVLTYQFGHEITNRPDIIDIHQRYWKLYGDPENPAIFRYTFKDLADLNRKIGHTSIGFSAVQVDDEPGVIIETMLLQTSGNNSEIPRTFKELTNEDYSNYNIMGNTRVLVTFTVDETKRRIIPRGAQRLPDFVLEQMLELYKDSEFIITYSPATQSALKLHTRHGAKPVMFLPNARPGLYMGNERAEDVVVMGYTWPRFMQPDEFTAKMSIQPCQQEPRIPAFV
ncbi:MAG TPA: hypothetical protein VJB05_01300 [archaeon]|nr:hypothetical protein [archaeon]